jgi:hypothetical protein
LEGFNDLGRAHSDQHHQEKSRLGNKTIFNMGLDLSGMMVETGFAGVKLTETSVEWPI